MGWSRAVRAYGSLKKGTLKAEFPPCPKVESDEMQTNAVRRSASHDSSSWFGWIGKAVFTAFASFGISDSVHFPHINRFSSYARTNVSRNRQRTSRPRPPC